MPKYWGKQIFAHGSFPEVGQKQKTERKRKKERLNDSNNNAQLRIAMPPRVAHAKLPGPILIEHKHKEIQPFFRADEEISRALEILEPIVDLPTNGATSVQGEKKIRPVSSNYQNWSDLFFILDVMSGYIDICEILIFISKTDDLIAGIEYKKVDIHTSRLDLSISTLTLNFTQCGVIEKLMGKKEIDDKNCIIR